MLSSLICISTATLLAKADTQPVSKTTTVTFSESLQQNQSQTINLPNLQSVDKVSTDNGNVLFTKSGSNVTISVSNGSVKQSVTPSKAASGTTDQYLNSTFPATKAYNDGTYSGTLTLSGSSYVVGGSYTPVDTKTATASQTNSSNSFPATVYYNDGVYSGTLSKNGSSLVSSGSYTAPWDEQVLISQPSGSFQWWATDYGESALYAANPPTAHDYMGGAAGPNPWDWPSEYTVIQYYWSSGVTYSPLHGCDVRWTYIQYNHYQTIHHNAVDTRVYSQNYSGQVTKPAADTRTWRQDYSGTVYAPTQNYYSYVVTINYTSAYEKPVLNVSADNQGNCTALSWTMSDTTQAYQYTIYRKDPSDSSFQGVASSLTGTSWTDTGGRDTAPPNAPTILGVSHNSDFSQYTVNYSSTDTGTAYQYYVEAVGQSDGTRIQSPTVSATVTTGIKGYSIVVDDSSGTVPNGTITSTVSSYTFTTPASDDYYIHVNAVDNAGNISTVIHYHLDDMVSVTHPISVSYSIDPNSSTPFVAPDIPIKNNSTFPVKVSVAGLKSASGISDVSPSTYTDWNNLTASQTESGIALDVCVKETATDSGSWLEIDRTTPIYATDITSTTLLGALNPNGATGNLSLGAKYGLAWTQAHTTVHNLVLDFEIDG